MQADSVSDSVQAKMTQAEVIKQLFAIVGGDSLHISLRNLRQCSVQLCRDLDNAELANERGLRRQQRRLFEGFPSILNWTCQSQSNQAAERTNDRISDNCL